MKTYLHKEFIDESLLKEAEREELQSEYQQMLNTIEKKYALQQQRFMEQQDALYERFAKEAGFSGYDSGEDSYNKHYKTSLSDSRAVSQEIHDKLYDFNMRKIHSDDYMSLVKRSKQAVTDERKEKIWAEQLYLNKVLERIRPHTVKRLDNDGNRIMGARTWNKLDEETKEKLNKPISREFTVKTGNEVNKVAIDAGINEYVTRLWDWGIRTNACCSGMVVDHPNDRWADNDRFGRWKRGDLIKATGNVCSTYLSIPYKGNHPELMKRAADKAHDWGWITENRKVYDEEALVFYPPHTLDGSDYGELLHEARDLRDSIIHSGEATDEEEAYYKAMAKVEHMHGGVIHRTDRMIDHDFQQLTNGLVEIRDKLRQEERQQNIDNGRAVDLYRYDSDVELTVPQLKAVFARSGIELDEPTVNRPLNKYCSFAVKDGMARLLPDGGPLYRWEMVDKNEPLSYLMASQVKSTIHGGENMDGTNYITVMIHPAAQTLEQSNKFTLKKELNSWDYYKYMGNESDMARLLSNQFRDDLYRAAQDAYDHSIQKKVDDLKPQMAVSDIRIRKGMDNNVYISCKVFGEQQLSKRMNTVDINYYNTRMRSSDKAYNGVAPELALKYYKEEIDLAKHLQQKESQTVKR
mgnify:CR=1 FL=1